MKKSKNSKIPIPHNPVAKYANQFNKTQVFRDKTKYKRKAKHLNLEPLPIQLKGFIGKGFFIPTLNTIYFSSSSAHLMHNLVKGNAFIRSFLIGSPQASQIP
ncbi:MAG: DUF7230 family protein [Gammaproteobacteria bacterium]